MNRAETLEQLAKLCRGGRADVAAPTIEPSGMSALDAALPGGGWQAGTIVELMPTDIGVGELRLIMPALARITNADRHVALISPPFIPYAPALWQHGVQLNRLLLFRAQTPRDVLWSFEQTLRCKSFGAALAWPTTIRDRDIRRLQLAAEAGDSIGFLYRPATAAHDASPAAVRLRLQPDQDGVLRIDIIKCRGARGGISIHLDFRNSKQIENERSAPAAESSDNPPSGISGWTEIPEARVSRG
jgi:hypothetical protein